MARGAYKCPACGGMFVPRLAVELIGEEGAADPVPPEEQHDAQGGCCPLDRSILIRAEIEFGDGQPAIHLERCGSCHGVWFDKGEWSDLAERRLLENIDEFWTPEWRADQRQRRDRANYDRRLRESFGAELYDALQGIAARLKGHERRSQALAFLREASDD